MRRKAEDGFLGEREARGLERRKNTLKSKVKKENNNVSSDTETEERWT